MSPTDLNDIRFALADGYEDADRQTIFRDIELLLEHIDKLQAVADAAQQAFDAAERLRTTTAALSLHG